MPNQQFPNPPFYTAGFGIGTEYGTFVPPGSRVTYVCSAGASYGGGNDAQAKVAYPTLAAGLAQCRSGLSDTVILLAGHTENFTDNTVLANLVAGTRIIGFGRGSLRPKLRLTNTAGSILANKADVFFQNIHFGLEGANGITKGIVVTGADNTFDSCIFEVASGATAKSAIAVEIGTGAARCRITNSIFRGTATHAVTDGVKIVAALDEVALLNNEYQFSATETNGLVHVTAAATGLKIGYSLMANTVASSTACIVVDDVAATGTFYYNHYNTLNNGTASAQGAIFGSGALIRSIQCFSTDEPKKSGILAPAAGT